LTHRQPTAVIYARVSTADQDCSRQVRDLEAFAQRAGYTVVATFIETASGIKNDRHERAKVIALAQARKIDAVLVTEMTRWGRSLQDLIETLNQLKAYSVSLIAEKGFQFDLNSPQGKLLAGILGSIAEFEHDLLRERINSGLANARAKGKKLGRPIGNRIDAKIGKKVMSLLDGGLSVRKTAREVGCSTTTVQAIKRRNAAE